MVANAEDLFEQLETPIGGVPPEHIMTVWSRAEPLLRRCVRPESGYTLETLLTALQMSKLQMWVIGDFQGVVCTQIKVNDPPVPPILWVQFLAGDHMDDWLEDWRVVMEAFALANGCNAVEFAGRKGWNKIGESYPDYKATWTVFRKELDDGE